MMSYWKSTAVVAIALIATCGVAQATAIVFDANSGVGGTADPTWSHTVGSGSDRILIVGVIYEGADPNIESITYGGVGLTLATTGFVGGGGTMQTTALWYLLNPATGTADIAIDHQFNETGVSAGGISLANVKQQSPEATANGSEAADPISVSTAITTFTDGAWVIDVVGDGGNVNARDPSAIGMVKQWDETASSAGGAGSSRAVATAGEITNTWDMNTQGNRLSHSLAAWAPVPEPATMALLAFGGVGVLLRRRRS